MLRTRRTSPDRRLLALSGAALVAVLGACAAPAAPAPGAAPASGDAAAEESVLTIYSGRGEELVDPLLEQLAEAVGGEVEVRYGSTGEMAAQLVEEGANTPADVFFVQDAGALGAVAEAGLLAPLPDDVIAAAEPRYRAADATWVATSARARVVAYNTDLVTADELPANLDALLDPRWSGRIGFAPSNASWLAFVTGLRLVRGEDGAREWLTAFAATSPQSFDGNGAVLDAVTAGTVDIGLINHYYLYEALAEESAADVPVANHYVPNDPLGLVNVAGVGVTTAADDPQRAQAAVEFLLSAQAQQYFVDETAEYPVVAGITPSADALTQAVPLAPLDSLSPPDVDLAQLSSLAETEALLTEVGLL